MLQLKAFVVSALSFVAVSAIASSSFANIPAQGCSLQALPDGTSLPANTPAMFLMAHATSATATVSAELVTGSTRAAFVGPVKDAHDHDILRFPLASEGSHKLVTKLACSVGSDRTIERSITLTAPVAFPKTVGTLTVEPSPSVNGYRAIVLRPTPELRAFAPVSKMKLFVNGQEEAYGLTLEQTVPELHVTVPTGRACFENGALLRDKRTAKLSVSADIAGVAESPAAATLDVDVDCGAIQWTTEPGGLADGTPSTTAAADGTGTTGGDDDGGCSASPSRSFPGSTTVLALGAAAVLAGLRRRRSRA